MDFIEFGRVEENFHDSCLHEEILAVNLHSA